MSLNCLENVDLIRGVYSTLLLFSHQVVSDTSWPPWTAACQGPRPSPSLEFAIFWRYAEIICAFLCFSNVRIIQYGPLNKVFTLWLNCTNNHKAKYVCGLNKIFQSRSPEDWLQNIFKYCLSPSGQVSPLLFKKKCPSSSYTLICEVNSPQVKEKKYVKYEIWHLWGYILAPSASSGTYNLKNVKI